MTLSCPRDCLGVTVSVEGGNPPLGPGVEAGGKRRGKGRGKRMDLYAEQVLTPPPQRASNSRKTAHPELTGEVAMVGAPLDTTRADRGGAAAPADRGGVLRRLLRSSGEPKSVTDIADTH